MRLIEDLGLREYGHQGRVKLFGMYECPVCHKHFECRVSSVKNGNTTRCRSCGHKATANAKSTKAASEFIEKARAIHGNLYEYLLVDYINNCTKVKITCPVHGMFEQSPSDHLSGCGCPHCAKERSNIALRMSEKNDKPTTLYYIYFPEVNLWKIGCTSKTIGKRFKDDKLEHIILHTKEYTSGNEAYRVEKFILDATKANQFNGIVLKGGNSELRSIEIPNILELIHEAEKAFSLLN